LTAPCDPGHPVGLINTSLHEPRKITALTGLSYTSFSEALGRSDKPRRGCASKPRVGVLAYPGNQRRCPPTLKGLRPVQKDRESPVPWSIPQTDMADGCGLQPEEQLRCWETQIDWANGILWNSTESDCCLTGSRMAVATRRGWVEGPFHHSPLSERR
jgi:hypothetical protein